MAQFDPSLTLFAYERGTQAFLISGATGDITQVGTAKPATANAYGLVGAVSKNVQAPNAAIQVDIGGSGSWTALPVKILGSLDNSNFYPIATLAAAAGGLFFLTGTAQVRYLSASIVGSTVASGAPTATVSFTI